MQELPGLIVNHPNGKTFLIELLNSIASPFFYETISALSINNGWKNPEVTKEDIKKILNGFLNTHNGVKQFFKPTTLEEETVHSALIYLLNTFHNKTKEQFPAATVATWIALERREEEFRQFLRDARQDEPAVKIGKALLAFWYYSD